MSDKFKYVSIVWLFSEWETSPKTKFEKAGVLGLILFSLHYEKYRKQTQIRRKYDNKILGC